jgi:hypothetical protein
VLLTCRRDVLVPVVGSAKAVIGQRFDDPAITDAAVSAFLNHPRQLTLERLQTGDPPFDLAEVVAGNAFGGVARGLRLRAHGQQFADVVDLEAEFAGVGDEVEPIDLRLAISTLVALGPWRRIEEPDLLVEANGRDF